MKKSNRAGQTKSPYIDQGVEEVCEQITESYNEGTVDQAQYNDSNQKKTNSNQ